MRARLALLAIAATTSGLVAQTTNPVNNFWRWDRSTEFTSRGANGGNPGFVSQGFSHGHTANLDTLTQTSFVMQDQNPSTRESYDVGTTELDGAGRPDYANMRAYATNLMLPVSTQTTPGAWLITVTGLTATPHKLNLQSHDQWHHVWKINQPANWTTDGISVHMSQAAAYQNSLLCVNTAHREIPRTEGTSQIVENLGWSAVAMSTTPRALNRTWRLRTSWAEFPLNGGAVNSTYGGYYGGANTIGCNTTDPNVGYAALDPDFADVGLGSPARVDDYSWILEAGAAQAGKFAVLFFSQTCFANGGVATPFGQLHLDLSDAIFNAVGPQVMPVLSTSGQSVYSLQFGAANSALRPVVRDFPNWSAQAAVITDSGLQLTNLFSFRTLLTPPGYASATADATTPFTTARAVTDNFFWIRNDGPGTLKVTLKRGTTEFGTANICERTAVRMVATGAANTVEVTTTSTQPVNFVWDLK